MSGVVYVNEETTENGPTSNVMINTNSSSEVEVEYSPTEGKKLK